MKNLIVSILIFAFSQPVLPASTGSHGSTTAGVENTGGHGTVGGGIIKKWRRKGAGWSVEKVPEFEHKMHQIDAIEKGFDKLIEIAQKKYEECKLGKAKFKNEYTLYLELAPLEVLHAAQHDGKCSRKSPPPTGVGCVVHDEYFAAELKEVMKFEKETYIKLFEVKYKITKEEARNMTEFYLGLVEDD